MTTRNGQPHLTEQLASLITQTCSPTELIVGDDASTDGTLDVLDNWATAAPFPVTVIHHSAALGQVANLAACLDRAVGDIVLVCDQDDVWRSQKIERTLMRLAATPGLAGAFCDSALIDASGTPVAGSLWGTLGFDVAEQEAVTEGRGLPILLRRNVAAGHALAIRRDRLRVLLPFPDIDHADWWLALGSLFLGGLAVMRERLVDYRLHGANSVGLRGRMPVRRRLDSTNPRSRSARDAILLKALVERLESAAPGSLGPDERQLLERKAAHATARAALPTSRPSRLLPLLREVRLGGYDLFANGWRSAALDLLAK